MTTMISLIRNVKIKNEIKTNKLMGKVYSIFFSLLTKKSKSRFYKFKKVYKRFQVKWKSKVKYDETYEKLAIIEESEERHKLTLESTDDAIWEINLITKMFYSANGFNDITRLLF